MQLDQALVTRLRNPIQKTWNYIGSDIENCMAECGERMTNAHAMEACLDADRLSEPYIGNDPEGMEILRAAFKEHGYQKVMKFLGKNIKLA
jgi:hypothetical protein